MNSQFSLLIKLLIVLVIVLIAVVVLFVAKATNFSFKDKNDEPIQSSKKSTKELSDEEIKKINDSMEQRENRIKSLKEVGKKLGG